MSREMNDPETARLEAALAALAPAAAQIDRDALMFNAGRRSTARGRFWPCAAALCASVAAGLGAVLALRPEPQGVERVVHVAVPAPPVQAVVVQPPAARTETVSAERAPLSVGALLERALRWGVDGLPTPAVGVPTAAGHAPGQLPGASSYQQLRMALKTGGEL
jgi:hypothetical protein